VLTLALGGTIAAESGMVLKTASTSVRAKADRVGRSNCLKKVRARFTTSLETDSNGTSAACMCKAHQCTLQQQLVEQKELKSE
jgi:hypothetical protein